MQNVGNKQEKYKKWGNFGGGAGARGGRLPAVSAFPYEQKRGDKFISFFFLLL